MARLTTAPGWGNVSENRWGKVSEKLSRYWGNDSEKRQSAVGVFAGTAHF